MNRDNCEKLYEALKANPPNFYMGAHTLCILGVAHKLIKEKEHVEFEDFSTCGDIVKWLDVPYDKLYDITMTAEVMRLTADQAAEKFYETFMKEKHTHDINCVPGCREIEEL